MNHVTIYTPKQLSCKRVQKEVETLMQSGVKSFDIRLKLEFFTTDELINELLNDFRIVKNKIAFKLDQR